jgi:aspartate/methionine/tyrosine aminotransferase
MLSDSHEEFHRNIIRLLETSSDMLYQRISQIETLNCTSKPQGSMFMMVQLFSQIVFYYFCNILFMYSIILKKMLRVCTTLDESIL